MGMGLGQLGGLGRLGRPSLNAGGSDPILAIFADGTDGFYFDFSKTDRLFQTQAGLTAVASSTDPVGVALDSHSWGGLEYAAILAAATELFPDGGMTDAVTGWTYTNCTGAIVGGALRVQSTVSGAATRSAAKTVSGLTIGNWYVVSLDAVGAGGLDSGTLTSRVQALTTGFVAVQDSQVINAAGKRSLIFRATGTSHIIQCRWNVSGGDSTTYVDFDNLSDKYVPGNHAVQATGAAQPKWQAGGLNRFDGTDDTLISTLTASGASGITLAAKVTVGAGGAVRTVIGGGTGDRLRLTTDTSGQLSAGIGGQSEGTIFRSGSLVGQTGVGVVTADGSTVKLYWNGVEAYSAAQLAGFATAISIAVGSYNNSGTPSLFYNSDIYHALAIRKVLTAAEITAITNLWGTS